MRELSNRAGTNAAEMARYTERLRGLAGADPIGALAGFPERLKARVSDLRRLALVTPEGGSRWSVLQVLEHLTDHEMIVGVRIRMILAHDEPEIQPFDQDLWATRLHWRDREVAETLEDFRALRTRNVRLVRSLSEAELERAGIHRERGRETVRHFIQLTAGHDQAHLNQIERIRSVVAS
jgi:hypothetical protein